MYGNEVDIVSIEYSYIGGCFTDPNIIGEIPVTPDHFSDAVCAEIYKNMREGVHDAMIIARDTGYNEQVSQMILASIDSHTRQQGREIIADYKRRKFNHAIFMAQHELSNRSISVDAALEDLIKAVDNSADSTYRHIGQFASDVFLDMQARVDGTGSERFIKSGYKDFDRFTGGLERGSLVVVAGRPGSGKTSFAMGVCQKVSLHHSVAVSSIEMDNLSMAYRITASLSGLDLKLLRTASQFPSEAWTGAATATQEMSDMQLYIDDNPSRTISQIASQARRQKAIKGLDVLMVDYLGLIESDGKNKPRHLEIADMTRTLKGIAKELNCCVMLLCQLNREADGKKPKLSHLRESGAVEQDADMVIFPYRWTEMEMEGGKEIEVDKAELVVGKNRNGATGDVPIFWHGKSASYKEATHEDRF